MASKSRSAAAKKAWKTRRSRYGKSGVSSKDASKILGRKYANKKGYSKNQLLSLKHKRSGVSVAQAVRGKPLNKKWNRSSPY